MKSNDEKRNYSAPFVGIAYYPEAWDESEIPKDVAKMAEYGIKCVRMGEFAWATMEPEPGKYDFSLFHKVLDELDKYGIRAIMGTPTPCPPIWFTEKYPDSFILDASGVRARHGGRRKHCTNHPAYYEYSMKIAEAVAKEFGRDPRVIGWQIDNEIIRQDCDCDYCKRGFHKYLEEKYGTVEALNKAWNTGVFSQRYTKFEQVPIPFNGWHNPHIRLDWRLYTSKVQTDFIGAQADIIRKYSSAPMGANPMYDLADTEEMLAKCTIVEYNHYDTPAELPRQRFWMDYARALKDRPFWNTETSTCWNGGIATTHSIKPYGFCRVNSWLPVAYGGEANMYWLWRTHHGGHELTHGAMLSPQGRPFHVVDEVKRVADEFEKCADFVNGTVVDADTAFHFTTPNFMMAQTQPLINDFAYLNGMLKNMYSEVAKIGGTDVIGLKKPLDKYKLLFSPFMMSLKAEQPAGKIAAWVKNGGVWVVGPMTDIRDEIGGHFLHSPYGMLEELTGARQAYEIPDTVGQLKCAWKDGAGFGGGVRYEVFEDNGDALVTVTDGYPTVVGKAVVLRKKVGKGVVYILGAVPSAEDYRKIVEMAARDAGVSIFRTEGQLAIAKRKGTGVEGLFVLECGGGEGSIVLPEAMTDLLTGKTYSGKVSLAPYDMLILKK